MEEKIPVFVTNGFALVWNAEDVRDLRQLHRINGDTIGCLPTMATQNQFLGLPLRLMPEEVMLLLDKGVIETFRDEGPFDLGAAELRQLAEHEDAIMQRQILIRKRRREEEIAAHAFEAHLETERKRLKLPASSAETRVSAAAPTEAAGPDATPTRTHRQGGGDAALLLSPIPADEPAEELDAALLPAGLTAEQQQLEQAKLACNICIPTDYHRNTRRPERFPCFDTATLGPQERSRFIIFKDLWERGFCMTSGSKFGGEYLVYPGDPHRFHAQFVAIIVKWNGQISPLDLTSYGRLGTTVKKAPLLCAVDENGLAQYLSIKWTGDSG